MDGTRKFVIAILCLGVAFGGFLFTLRDLSCYIALAGIIGAIVKLYNDANIKEHELKNGNGNGK